MHKHGNIDHTQILYFSYSTIYNYVFITARPCTFYSQLHQGAFGLALSASYSICLLKHALYSYVYTYMQLASAIPLAKLQQYV